MNVNSGQTFTIAQFELLTDNLARSFNWYVQDNNIAPNASDPNSATASSLAPDGWNVAYDIPSSTFTVTVSSNSAYQGRSFHVGFRDGAVPSNNYWISLDFSVATAPALAPPRNLTIVVAY